MKTTSALIGAAAALGLSFAGLSGAAAQYTAPGLSLSASSLSAMTCATYTHLSPRHRDSLVRQAISSGPPPSLSTLTVQPNRRNGSGGRIETGTAPGTPLTSGALIAACQAATPSSTLGDAYSQANSAPNSFPRRPRR